MFFGNDGERKQTQVTLSQNTILEEIVMNFYKFQVKVRLIGVMKEKDRVIRFGTWMIDLA